jgi:hypothetical protein
VKNVKMISHLPLRAEALIRTVASKEIKEMNVSIPDFINIPIHEPREGINAIQHSAEFVEKRITTIAKSEKCLKLEHPVHEIYVTTQLSLKIVNAEDALS